MATTFPYDSNEYDPAAPVLRLVASAPASRGSSVHEEVSALCDTGADLTCLPLGVVEGLGLLEVDEIEVKPYEGAPQLKAVFSANIGVPGLNPQIARVISIDGPHAILGRDLLNLFRLE